MSNFISSSKILFRNSRLKHVKITKDFTTKSLPQDYHDYDRLYKGHIPTSSVQKMFLTFGSSLITFFNPSRGDMLAVFGETSGLQALKLMKKKMESDFEGRTILKEKPRINSKSVNMNWLGQLPLGTFGRVYHDWLKPNEAHPDDRMPVQFVDDPELAYVMQRYREIHDISHVMLGMNTNMIGEVTVKVFEGIQTKLPMCVSGGVLGTFRLGPKHRKLYFDTHLKYAVKQGLFAHPFMNVYFEKYWEEDLEKLRKKLKIDPPPTTPKKKNRYNLKKIHNL